MRSYARTASLQQSTRLDLQPHEPRDGHVGVSPTPALAMRVPVHAEWHFVRRRAGHGRRLALLVAPPDRSVSRAQDAAILPRFSFRQTGAPPMAASPL